MANYTRSKGVTITLFGGYEAHKIYGPDGKLICNVMAPSLVDPKAPKPVTAQADELLRHLNREQLLQNANQVLDRMGLPYSEVINAAEFLRRLNEAGLLVIDNPLLPTYENSQTTTG